MESTRQRMIVSTAELLADAGLAGVSFGTVLARSQTPRGSIYHHFPGGKDELVAETVRWIGERLARVLAEDDPRTAAEVVTGFARPFRRLVATSDRSRGCAIAAVASSAAPATTPARAAAGAFMSWLQLLARQFAATGVPRDRCDRLARSTLVTVEGAVLVARACGDVAVFDESVEAFVRSLPGPDAR